MTPLALTMGEPAGVGPELALKIYRGQMRGDGVACFAVIGDSDHLEEMNRRLGWAVPVAAIRDIEQAPDCFRTALPVLPCPLAAPVTPGTADPRNAEAVIESIRRAVALAQSGRAGAVVTNPIHKGVLHAAGFAHPGHTEFLAELAGPGTRVAMMLACPVLRVVPVTIHQALKDAVAGLTTARIVEVGGIADAALRRDFGIARPRLAVAALNPHGGEGGMLGSEEIEIIAPAVAALQAAGVAAFGPVVADTLFHAAARESFDAALCMYHDQALIPLKTLDFAGGVNITLGLPFIRTSPDHGVAFDIAGRGVADETSLFQALAMAARLAQARRACR